MAVRSRWHALLLASLLATGLMASSCSGGGDVEVAATSSTVDEEAPEPSVQGTTETPSVTAPAESQGCAADAVPKTGQQALDIRSDALERVAGYYVPSNYDGETAVPLVINLHPYISPANVQVSISGMHDLAEEQGFITVEPQGLGEYPYWNVVRDPALADDVAFIEAVIDELANRLCIDERRVYATGHEMGSQMVTVLACDLSDRITAIALVAGVYLPEPCDQQRPVPTVVYHGTEDTWQLYEGGIGPGSFVLPTDEQTELLIAAIDVPGVIEFAEAWAEQNGCDGPTTQTSVAADVKLNLYQGCENNAAVLVYTVVGMAHAWPGTVEGQVFEEVIGAGSDAIDATESMWDFFQDHAIAG
ncbi:MAG: hypothetical protein JJLCMIEE_02878 [Acidimicrobiales bacterium]|nr:hypothetical protein [Acidimicrobiales bacterium]